MGKAFWRYLKFAFFQSFSKSTYLFLLKINPSFYAKKNSPFSFSLLFDYASFSEIFFLYLSWAKLRVLYYINNWVYTTNHKRIAVNYFWFVILAGIIGMVLATVIRLELAYPGVGVFAGDSLQYLSLVTAHGVIMVFFMIMPLMFGAFANFLLPTQLGVHDVAFPRLNSAAFWFLPAGLIMLAQLVCVDRRYQRMNCFNIREIQSILKRRFFTDLINSQDSHSLLNKTAIGLRFKLNGVNPADSSMFLMQVYGTDLNLKHRAVDYRSVEDYALSVKSLLSGDFSFFNFVSFFNNRRLVRLINKILLKILRIFDFKNTTITPFLSFYNQLYNVLVNGQKIYFSNMIEVCKSAIKSRLYDPIKKLCSKLNVVEHLRSLFYRQIYPKLESTPSLIFFYLSQVCDRLERCWPFICYLCDHVYMFPTEDPNRVSFKPATVAQYIGMGMSGAHNRVFHTIKYSELKVLYPFDISDVYVQQFFVYCRCFINFLGKKAGSFLVELINFVGNFINFYSYPRLAKVLNFFFNYFFEKDLINLTHLCTQITPEIINFWPCYQLKNERLKSLGLVPSSIIEEFTYSFSFVLVYMHTIYNLWMNFFSFLWNIVFYGARSTRAILAANSFYSYFLDWYLPLLFSDNLFLARDFLLKNGLIGVLRLAAFESIPTTLKNYFKVEGVALKVFPATNGFTLIEYPFNFLIASPEAYISESCSFFLSAFNFSKQFISSVCYYDGCFIINALYSLFSFEFWKNFILSFRSVRYRSNYFSETDLLHKSTLSNLELSASNRNLRFNNPVFKYDYKSGDYFPKFYKEVYLYLFTTISDLTSALRSSPWFFSTSYAETFKNNFLSFANSFSKISGLANFSLHAANPAKLNNADAFYNFFFALNSESLFINKQWVSLSSLNQKFYRMFHTSSMQQRIYSNWRQLKFTREAWRCKLLSARHQKTLYRRYVHEDGVFWSIERNAKDLLPGWAMITPFSSRMRYTAVGKVDIGLMGVLLVLNSSIISAANFLVTYRYLSTLNNRKMRDARSFFTEGVMVASWMMIAANPMLIIGIIMLLSDRHWQTSFFDYSGGGDTVLFQHMFWFFGHPEVYIILIPVFGFTNTTLSYFLKKRVSARASLLYSMYTIAFLGFFVWGHHMYMVGLAHTTRMLFSTLTVMISVPAATKLMHWCVTLANSSFTMELPFLCTLTFIFLFVSGGISGMCVAHTGMDILFHDTFYVIGHFHIMFAGAAMFGSFGAFYFYFVAIFGVKYSRIWAYLHYSYYLVGHFMTFIPMFWLGYAGMPRRVLDYPASLGGWHSVISAGHMLSVAGLIAFFIMIFDSLRQARALTRSTFGVSRYNTRLNFYLYEIARSLHVQRKSFQFFRFLRLSSIKINNKNFYNFESLETTLFSYEFKKKVKKV